MTWYRNGQTISNGGRFLLDCGVRGTFSLVIHAVCEEDRGKYTCEASNGSGARQVTVELTVEGESRGVPRQELSCQLQGLRLRFSLLSEMEGLRREATLSVRFWTVLTHVAALPCDSHHTKSTNRFLAVTFQRAAWPIPQSPHLSPHCGQALPHLTRPQDFALSLSQRRALVVALQLAHTHVLQASARAPQLREPPLTPQLSPPLPVNSSQFSFKACRPLAHCTALRHRVTILSITISSASGTFSAQVNTKCLGNDWNGLYHH